MTQLYVSVDAGTRDGLKAIDRPLFKDFWQRFLDCLTELRDKRQRTVYRCSHTHAHIRFFKSAYPQESTSAFYRTSCPIGREPL